MQTFVINLDARSDKWAWMQKQLLQYPFLQVERIPAVLGSAVDLSSVKLGYRAQRAILGKKKTGHYDLDSVGNLGCFLSHLSVWKRIAQMQNGDKPILILEDDAHFHTDPTSALQTLQEGGLEVAWLGANKEPLTQGSASIANQTFPFLKSWTQGGNDACGSHAYFITPRVAKLLVEGATVLDLSPDFYIHARLAELRIPVVYINLAHQAAFWKGPDIIHPSMPHEEVANRKGFVFGCIAMLVILLAVLLAARYALPKAAKEVLSTLLLH